MIQLLFPQLTREHAIQLERMVDDYCSTKQREQQIHALEVFLCSDGLPYSSRAALNILRDLVPYTERVARDYGVTGEPLRNDALPQCVYEAYRIMFDSFDACLTHIIKEHWELETVEEENPDACITKYSETFYDEGEAYLAYAMARAHGDYVRLIHVDEVQSIPDVLEVSWMV